MTRTQTESGRHFCHVDVLPATATSSARRSEPTVTQLAKGFPGTLDQLLAVGTTRRAYLEVIIFVDFFVLDYQVGVLFWGARISNSHSSFREGFVSGTQPAGLLCTVSQADYCKVVSPRLITTPSLGTYLDV